MERILCVCLYVTSFQINPYLGCFKSEIDAVCHGILYDVKTSEVITNDIMMYDVMTFDIMTYYVLTYGVKTYDIKMHGVRTYDTWRHDI